jgi:nitroreductase
MEITEAINKRKSIRIFKADPVPREVLQELMESALRAPSWANTQPWEFAIVSGAQLEQVRQGFIGKIKEEPHPDLARPHSFPEPYNSRRHALGKRDAEAIKKSREGMDIEQWRPMQGSRLYGAPCVIYIYIDRAFYFQGGSINVWPVFDCGLIAENIMLLAMKFGLGTIPAAQTAKYPEVLRNILGIPDSKLIVIGIGIGYPDWDHPFNQLYSQREPLDKIARWYGFD